MRSRWWLGALAAGIAVLGLRFGFTTSVVPKKTGQPTLKWQNAYWVWQGDAPLYVTDRLPLLYVQVQATRWPASLPEADEYVVVNRLEPTTELDDDLAARILQGYKALLISAGGRARITGLQIDYDCPTSRLKAYARFLKSIKTDLPHGKLLSITALLDWFKGDTAVDSALAVVDEFVPQFYDAAPDRNSFGIAEPIDARKWAPVFNAKNTPYKIGISTFGRIARRRISSDQPTVQYFRDASPLDFARQGFQRSVARTTAGEAVVRYEVTSNPHMSNVLSGDVVEVTFPTELSIRSAYEAVRQFGGYCDGALFFRWPTEGETLAFGPADVERILRGVPLPSKTELEVRDGSCLERRCSDLYLKLDAGVTTADRTIDIVVHDNLDLFVPGGPLQPVAFRNRIHVSVPAYSGLRSIYVGRAISTNTLEFEIGNP